MFKTTKNHKQYSIALKTANDNTVGFLNLSGHFISACTEKSPEALTAVDVLALTDDFEKFIQALRVEVTEVVPETKTNIKDF